MLHGGVENDFKSRRTFTAFYFSRSNQSQTLQSIHRMATFLRLRMLESSFLVFRVQFVDIIDVFADEIFWLVNLNLISLVKTSGILFFHFEFC